jgi:hypothetical protein
MITGKTLMDVIRYGNNPCPFQTQVDRHAREDDIQDWIAPHSFRASIETILPRRKDTEYGMASREKQP